MTNNKLLEIYQLLLDAFGPQGWWPGRTQFEIITGAILTQNTSWSNVEKAINNLKEADCLKAEKLYGMPDEKLAELIRPAGYFNIRRLFDWSASRSPISMISTCRSFLAPE